MEIIDFETHKKATVATPTTFRVEKRKIKPIRSCQHENINLSEEKMRCWCDDCKSTIHPFWILLEYADEQRVTERKLEALNAAIEEFKKIKAEWNLTLTEKRRITRASNMDSVERLFGGGGA